MLPGSGGCDGYQVVMADLLDASGTFGAEAATYKAIMPAGGPACPDGGDGAFNQSLQAVIELIGALHLQAAGVMEVDSAKLRKAHDTYARTEEDLTQLCKQISSPAQIS
ncbi:MAG TPA: DUF6317 family protein [Trebonia sp.]|nr:DUF6317 family protein [Trebonia sp.]